MARCPTEDRSQNETLALPLLTGAAHLLEALQLIYDRS